MTTHNTTNAAERPSDRAIAQAYYEACALGAENYLPSIEARARELDSHRPAESVSAEGAVYQVRANCYPGELGQWKEVSRAEYDDASAYPSAAWYRRVLRHTESVSAEPVAWVPVHPRNGYLWANTTGDPCRERLPSYELVPLYLHPQPSTPGAVSDEWSPTIDDMPEGICVAKRIHVERERHMDNWFVGFGKDESCQIEGTANHWYWLAYALLGLVDEKDSPYSEDKPLPFSPAYIRAALESFAKRSATPKEDRHAQD